MWYSTVITDSQWQGELYSIASTLLVQILSLVRY